MLLDDCFFFPFTSHVSVGHVPMASAFEYSSERPRTGLAVPVPAENTAKTTLWYNRWLHEMALPTDACNPSFQSHTHHKHVTWRKEEEKRGTGGTAAGVELDDVSQGACGGQRGKQALSLSFPVRNRSPVVLARK